MLAGGGGGVAFGLWCVLPAVTAVATESFGALAIAHAHGVVPAFSAVRPVGDQPLVPCVGGGGCSDAERGGGVRARGVCVEPGAMMMVVVMVMMNALHGYEGLDCAVVV